MENEKLQFEIPPVFRRLDGGDLVDVHDYELSQVDGRFGYIRQSLIGQPPTADVVAMRPVVTVLNILDMLQSGVCVCGSYKPRGRSHCPGCYNSLPPEKQKALYRRFRNGYEAAFLDSLITLVDIGRSTLDKIRAAVPVPKGA